MLNEEDIGQNPAFDQWFFPRSERSPGTRGGFPQPPIGADDPDRHRPNFVPKFGALVTAIRAPVPRRTPTAQCRCQNYQAIPNLVFYTANCPEGPQAPRSHPSSPAAPSEVPAPNNNSANRNTSVTAAPTLI